MDTSGQFHRILTKCAILKYDLPFPLFDLCTLKTFQFQLRHDSNKTRLFLQFPYRPPKLQKIEILVQNRPIYHPRQDYVVTNSTFVNRLVDHDSSDWSYFDESKYVMDSGDLADSIYYKNRIIDDCNLDAEKSAKEKIDK